MVEVNRQRKLALRFEPPPFQALDRLVKKARTTIEKHGGVERARRREGPARRRHVAHQLLLSLDDV